MNYDLIYIWTDGGARGNPGPAAVGAVIKASQGGETGDFFEIGTLAKTIGEATNNEAEYQGVIAALVFLKEQGIRAETIKIHMDSQVVSQQLAGAFKIKKKHLQNLYQIVKQIEPAVGKRFIYVTIPRAANAAADALVNTALDNALNQNI